MMEYRPSIRRKCAGWSLIALAPIGGLLPVLPGLVFLVLGLFVLRHQYHWAHNALSWADSRWPGAVAKVEVMETRMVLRADRTIQGLRDRSRRIFDRAG